MTLAALLFSQGFGTRRECAALAESGRAALAPGGQVLRVDGQAWPVHDKALIVLHKPLGVECSQKPGRWPSVMALLPAPLRRRGVQPVGRLDVDTSGLLLLTDDGTLLHRLTSPKHHVPKLYEVTTARPVDALQLQRLLQGVQLHGEPRPAQALAASATGECTLELTLAEGRYHQVRRMLAAVGNHVQALHRRRVGGYELPADLAPGQWRWLGPAERAAIIG